MPRTTASHSLHPAPTALAGERAARVAPTTMIFVPCLGGISHNEAESTTFDECAAGAQVLLNAVVEYDRSLG